MRDGGRGGQEHGTCFPPISLLLTCGGKTHFLSSQLSWLLPIPKTTPKPPENLPSIQGFPRATVDAPGPRRLPAWAMTFCCCASSLSMASISGGRSDGKALITWAMGRPRWPVVSGAGPFGKPKKTQTADHPITECLSLSVLCGLRQSLWWACTSCGHGQRVLA